MALTDKLTAIGNAIRSKTGGTDLIPLADMPAAIEGIPSGETFAGIFEYIMANGIMLSYDEVNSDTINVREKCTINSTEGIPISPKAVIIFFQSPLLNLVAWSREPFFYGGDETEMIVNIAPGDNATLKIQYDGTVSSFSDRDCSTPVPFSTFSYNVWLLPSFESL